VLHFNELFSKKTLIPDLGLPRVPLDGISLDKNNLGARGNNFVL